jgi:hypothetical protein
MRLKVILTYTIIQIFSLSQLFCQNYGSLANVEYADKLYAEGRVDEALTEYLRCIHFRVGQNNQIFKKISELYVIKRDYKNALKFLDRWYFENLSNDSILLEAIITKSQIFTLSNDYNAANVELLQAPHISDEKIQNRLNYYLLINYLLTNNVNEAENYIMKLDYLTSQNQTKLKDILDKIRKLNNKNPGRSMVLSSIIPGLGQAVNGNIKDGLISFLVVGGLAVLFVDIGLSISFADAGLSVGPWLMRYHIGGLSNAKNQAKLNISAKRFKLIKELNLFILQKSK